MITVLSAFSIGTFEIGSLVHEYIKKSNVIMLAKLWKVISISMT